MQEPIETVVITNEDVKELMNMDMKEIAKIFEIDKNVSLDLSQLSDEMLTELEKLVIWLEEEGKKGIS